MAEPYRHVGGFESLLHCGSQVVADRVQVYRAFQAGRERLHHPVPVVPDPVEPAVHRLLHPAPQRAEQGRGGQRGRGHRHRRAHRQHLLSQQHQARVHPDQQPGHDRVGQRPADNPVDLVQPVPQDRHPHAGRQGGHADHDHIAYRLPDAVMSPDDDTGEE